MYKKVIAQYICFCSKIKKKQYEEYLRENSEKSIENIFQGLKVGITCAACRIELEKIYVNYTKKKHSLNIKKNSLSYVYYLFNKLKFNSIYLNRKILKQSGPILNGKNITSELVISNFSFGEFSKHVVPFEIKLFIRDQIKNSLTYKKFILQPETRLVYKLNRVRVNNCNTNINTSGSFSIVMKSLKRGFIGVTRPHLRISSDSSLSTVHLQHGRSKPISYVVKINDNEIQYLSLVNLENKNNNFNIDILIDNKLQKKLDFNIQSFKSQLINLSALVNNIKVGRKKVTYLIKHYGILRRNIIIYSLINGSISMDHI